MSCLASLFALLSRASRAELRYRKRRRLARARSRTLARRAGPAPDRDSNLLQPQRRP